MVKSPDQKAFETTSKSKLYLPNKADDITQ